MKRKICLWIVYIWSVLSVCLPWFTYNPDVMGYCWGLAFAKWFAAPMVILAISLAKKERSRMLVALSEISLAANFSVLINALGSWQEVSNIGGQFSLREGLLTATPYFWISVLLHVVLFVLFQWELFGTPAKEEK